MVDKIVHRVRARRGESDSGAEEANYASVGSESEDEFEDVPDDSGSEEGSEEDDDLSDQELDDANDDNLSESEPDDIKADLSSISFGALAKAQSQLKRKRSLVDEDLDSEPEQEDIRPTKKPPSKDFDRLTTIKEQIRQLNAKNPTKLASLSKSGRPEREGNSRPNIEKRSSKHAPAEMSSKKAVSRRRDVVDLLKSTLRDPRFDSLGNGAPVDERKIQKNYAFLEQYREDEMRSLKEEIKKTKDEDSKWELEQQLKSMESRKFHNKKKQEAEDILAEHKKKEREAVKQGKNPFYLKKADQKKLILTTRFSKLTEKQREKAIEKKQKKKASKEKKNLPWGRRSEVL